MVMMNIISTHTSRVGCDESQGRIYQLEQKFLLTHPVWDVTIAKNKNQQGALISTHTSRVGCDIDWGERKTGK